MRHGYIVLLDIALRKAWYNGATLTDGLAVHAWWKHIRDFELTGN